MIPRVSPMVSLVAAIAAALTIPYYTLTGQTGWGLTMLALCAVNAICARGLR